MFEYKYLQLNLFFDVFNDDSFDVFINRLIHNVSFFVLLSMKMKMKMFIIPNLFSVL